MSPILLAAAAALCQVVRELGRFPYAASPPDATTAYF
jgi:hypothetical protein